MKKFAKRCVGALCIAALLIGFVPGFWVGFVSAENTDSVSPADLFVANSGVVSITPNVDFPDYSMEGNGVQIIVNDDASFRFANVVDISDFDLGKELLSFQVLSNQDKMVNLSNVYLTLTDIHDPENTLQIRFSSGWRYEGSVAAKYDSRWMFRNNYGHVPDYPQYSVVTDPSQASHGSWVDCNFDYNKFYENSQMSSYHEAGMPPFKVAIDYDVGTVYTLTAKEMSLYHGYKEWTSVVDMRDSTVVGLGQEWSRFTTGECYMDIKIELSDDNGTGGIIISQIAGQNLSGEEVLDQSAPRVYVDVDEDYLEQLPNATLDKPYILPTARALDIVDGELEVSIDVYKSDQKVTDQMLVDGKFVGTQKGGYVIAYSTKDRAGNEATVELNLRCVYAVQPMRVAFAGGVTSVNAGQEYVVPDIDVVGGTGKINIDAVYYYNDQEIQLDASRKIFLDKTGKLRAECTVSDAVGTVVFGSTNIEIDVVAEDAPVLLVSGVPHYAVSGKTLILPDCDAYNYSFDEDQESYHAVTKVLVNGKDVTTDLRYEVVETAGSVLNVQYIASSGGKTVEKNFEVPVYKLESIYDLVRYDDAITTNQWEETATLYSEFMGEGDYSIELANPVSATNLWFEIALSNDNIKHFDVVFTEFYGERELFLRFTKKDNTSAYMQVNGEGEFYTVDGSFMDASKHFQFILNESTGYLCDTMQRPLVKLDEWTDKSNFNGVAKGAVNLSIRVSGKEETSVSGIRLYRISNQTFMTANPNTAFVDRIGPAVYLYDQMRNYMMNIGDTLLVSAAEAYDVVDFNAEVFVSVLAPDGTTLIDKQSCHDSFEIVLDQYGYYSVIYYLSDSSSASKFASTNAARFSIQVIDTISPVAEVIGNMPEKIQLGQSIKIPVVSVYDDISGVTINTFVIDTSEIYHVVNDGESFLPTKPGKYRIVYYVVDETYNSTMVEYTVVVE